MEFNTHHGFEGELRGQQKSAAHARAEIDEGGRFHRGGGSGFAPALDERAKHGRGHAVVSRGVAVVAMAAFEVPAGDQSAGPHAKLGVEGMGSETVFDGEAGEKTTAGFRGRIGTCFDFNFHGLNVSIHGPCGLIQGWSFPGK